ncbi:MAG: glycosyltransferase family 2 protein [Candidatus Levybacteria bacterium]|nr:glycosyltransferase family 2 protein [Candidatus Levybacteria bacterium]
MKEKPLITVILPVRNCAETLADCLFSLLKQSYENLEIIAIDDFSIDNSMAILRSFKRKDKRLRIYKNVKSYGLAVTLNRLIKKTKGSFIAFMDPADISKLERLAKQYRFLVKNPEFVAVGSQCTFISETGKKIGKSNFPMENSAIYQNPLHGISMQFETVLINKLMLPKDILRFNIGSNPFIYSDIFMKIIPYGKFANLPQVLHYHRNHPKTYISEIRSNILSLIKLLIKSKALYDYQAPIRSFFTPLIKSA